MNDNTNQGLVSQVFGCLTSPRRTIQAISAKPDLKRATIIMLLIAIMAGLASYNYIGKLPFAPELLPGGGARPSGPFGGMFRPGVGSAGQTNPQFLLQIRTILGTVRGIVGILGSWLISSILCHMISKTRGGTGNFKNMATLAGYASAPFIIQNLLRLIDSFLVSEEELLRLMSGSQMFTSPFLNALSNVAIDSLNIFRLWSIILYVIAIRENYQLSTAKSVITAVIAYVLMMFISLVLSI